MRVGTTSCISILVVLCALVAEATVTVDVQPATPVLSVNGKPATVLVLVTNPTNERIGDLQLTTFPDPRIRVSTVTPIPSLPPQGDATWTLTLSADGAPIDGRIVLRIEYLQGATSSAQVKKISLTTITVKTQELVPIAQIVDVEARTTLASLDEQHPGEVYLVVANKSERSMTILPIEPQGPGFITFERSSAAALNSREVRAIRIPVNARDTVQPGKHLLIFPVTVEWQTATGPERATMVTTREVDVGVFAESEVLKLLGVPFFALLPGFLVVVTVGWFWKNRVWRDPDATPEFPLDVKSPEFWVVAITLSAVVAYLYRIYTGRDYLRAYGLADVITVWVISIFVFGFGSYVVFTLANRLRRWWWELQENEQPLSALRKLGRLGSGVRFDQVETSDASRALLMEPLRSDRPTVWVTSPIVVAWQATATDPLKESIESELEASGSPSRLANLLQQGMDTRQLELGWKANRGPRRVKTSDVKRKLAPYPIVEFA